MVNHPDDALNDTVESWASASIGSGVTAYNEGISRGKNHLVQWGAQQVLANLAPVTGAERAHFMRTIGHQIAEMEALLPGFPGRPSKERTVATRPDAVEHADTMAAAA